MDSSAITTIRSKGKAIIGIDEKVGNFAIPSKHIKGTLKKHLRLEFQLRKLPFTCISLFKDERKYKKAEGEPINRARNTYPLKAWGKFVKVAKQLAPCLSS